MPRLLTPLEAIKADRAPLYIQCDDNGIKLVFCKIGEGLVPVLHDGIGQNCPRYFKSKREAMRAKEAAEAVEYQLSILAQRRKHWNVR